MNDSKNNDVEAKYNLLESLAPHSFPIKPLFQLEVAGVRLQLCFHGRDEESVKKFLPKYFAHFDLSDNINESADISIIYWQPDGEIGQDHFSWWNDWPHEIEFFSAESYDKIMARDFVAKISKDAKKIYAHGPKWSFATCDSLDNLISYGLGRHLIKYQGLILHAACVVFKDEAYVFFGTSGAGKSTLAEFCFRFYGHKVISSDQLILRYEQNQLYAQVMPTTIPEFPLDHPARETKKIKIKLLCHLVQKNSDFSYENLEDTLWLKYFMRELVYRNEFGHEKEVLDLCLKIAQDQTIIKGEMSYQKESSFFEKLLKKINNEY